MADAYLNAIATAAPPHDIHRAFTAYAPSLLHTDKDRALFKKIVRRSHIDHRYSVIPAGTHPGQLDGANFYTPGNFPTTAARMRLYESAAFPLAQQAIDLLTLGTITHIIVTSCTGLYAPGLDLQIIAHYGLNTGIERTFIGFMGCQAAINALKAARHIVRSEPAARVLILNLELCTLHLHETGSVDELTSYLIFADGCAASIVSAEPHGVRLTQFRSTVLPDSANHITWRIGDQGFDMNLSRAVPGTIAKGLAANATAILAGADASAIAHWAVHPGGSGVLDAVQKGFGLTDDALHHSRDILRRYGNMSSPTVMFVLKEVIDSPPAPGPANSSLGCALSFGPGLSAESLLFQRV